jgi:hypothetical protein
MVDLSTKLVYIHIVLVFEEWAQMGASVRTGSQEKENKGVERTEGGDAWLVIRAAEWDSGEWRVASDEWGKTKRCPVIRAP